MPFSLRALAGPPRLLTGLSLVALLALLDACGQEGTTSTGATPTSVGSGGGGGEGGAGGSGPAPIPVVIANWNTHNFFDTLNDNPSGDVLSKTEYTKKKKTIGAAIKQIDADILVVCEIENKNILIDLNKNELGSAYSTVELFEGNDTRGIDVGLLSKIKPDSVISHKDEFFQSSVTKASYQYARDCLEVRFTINGRKVVVLATHFKAKVPTDSPDKRLAEAQHTRAIADAISKAEPTTGILILGDLNDTPGSPPINAIVGKAPNLFKGSADAAPEAERYSFIYKGTKELIDHQFANPIMAGLLDPSSVTVLHGPGIDDASAAASDHAPIVATYLIK